MLIYKDRLSPRVVHRVPRHLEGVDYFHRRESDGGDILALGDPLYLHEPEGARWTDVGDNWAATMVGPFEPREHLRRAKETPDLLPVADAKGRAWHAPAILHPDLKSPIGRPVIPLAWGRGADGHWTRVPSPEQQSWISAAQSARTEVLATRISEVPVGIAAEWAMTLLGAVYHLSPDVLASFNLLDDRLVIGVLLASAGFINDGA